jgi:hypothetical protein
MHPAAHADGGRAAQRELHENPPGTHDPLPQQRVTNILSPTSLLTTAPLGKQLEPSLSPRNPTPSPSPSKAAENFQMLDNNPPRPSQELARCSNREQAQRDLSQELTQSLGGEGCELQAMLEERDAEFARCAGLALMTSRHSHVSTLTIALFGSAALARWSKAR